MANLQDLESFEPLNPLTPDPDFGNLFCVFWQAIGEFQFAIPFLGASYWGIQQRAGPQNCSLLASYREIAHNPENGFYSLVSRCAYSFYKPFEMVLRAPIKRPRDQKWDPNWLES